MASKLKYLVYVSKESGKLSQTDLDEILAASQNYNDANKVSGILLYVEGRFFQVLEGPGDEVDLLFRNISKDPRHYEATIVAQGDLDKRFFKGWNMRFNKVSEEEFALLTGVRKFSTWFHVKPKEPNNPAWMFVQKFADKSFPSEGWWQE